MALGADGVGFRRGGFRLSHLDIRYERGLFLRLVRLGLVLRQNTGDVTIAAGDFFDEFCAGQLV